MVLSEGEPVSLSYKVDYPPLWANSIGKHSRIFLTPDQLDLFRKLLLTKYVGDQIAYAMVLAQTGGPVEVFIARENGIIFPSLLELAATG